MIQTAFTTDCLIAFGSNLGGEQTIYQQAIDQLAADPNITLIQASQPLSTRPVGGPPGQADYLNAAIRINTLASATRLHEALRQIEISLGRQHRERWAARKIDLDLLLYGTQVMTSDALVIPHPRMSFRKFVLRPALEIAGDMMHPICRMTLAELWHHLQHAARHVFWLTSIDRSVELLYQQLKTHAAKNDWQLTLADSSEKIPDDPAAIALIAHTAEFTDALNHRSYCGPSLQLPESLDQVEKELVAAMQAMN